ncbi:YeeE/YedE thiosulfate transporter family protein [uncultured Roseobacter sp.]|uniref:YeeE/YedE thiosulfate transporter family protein n=1 Tax=uncultured Roseobacter sp. TaxID=114847 RepID=UPI002605C67B|nr:YeeE/YedE thiosulfate transporter family protein [uncultured Roseobacter sp.]
MFLIPLLLGLSFLVGYAIRRGSICAVAATQSLIVDRRGARFRAFGVAAAGAGAAIIPLHWLFPADVTLSAGYPVTVSVVAAGAVFGLGARLNNACVLGTLAHLTGGNIVYGLSVLGMIIGATAMTSTDLALLNSVEPVPSQLEEPSVIGGAFVAVLATSLILALYRRVPRWLRGLRDPASARMGPYRSMLIVGISAGLLYALAGNWTYMSVLSNRAARLIDPALTASGWPVLICATTVIAGGVMAAIRYRDFQLQRHDPALAFRCFAGGAVMGASATVIPGGNGTMLVHGLPSLAPHAIAAYLAMTVVLCLSFLVTRRRLSA